MNERRPPTTPTAFRQTRAQRLVWRDHLPGLAVLVVGLAITLTAAIGSHRAAVEREERLLARRASNVAVSLENGLGLWLEVLAGLGALFDASDEVTATDFADFARPALARHPGMMALEWFPLVRRDQRAAFEAAARAQGLADFAIRRPGPGGTLEPAPPADEYLALRYAEPPVATAPWGLDLYFEAPRREPNDRARDSGAPAVSGRLRLVEDPPGVYSVAVHHPLYRRGLPRGTVAERRQAFVGVVVALVRLDAIASRILGKIDFTGLDVTLRDAQARGDDAVLLHLGPQLTDVGTHWSQPLTFAGREWTIDFRATSAATSGVGALVLGGILASLLLGGLISFMRVITRLKGAVLHAQRIGQYTLEQKLGEGGMGFVYRARHAMLRRPTALKILKSGDAAAASQVARFEEEVQRTAQLTHPNTVVVFDYGRTPDGTFYYAMEYLDGIDLDHLIEEDGAQPPARAVHMLLQAAGSLAEAHSVGLIHRDIKPANLMLCQRGDEPDVIKVLDFGLVAELSAGKHGEVVGTPMYMSPEALRHQPVDARSDLYALGLVAYYLVTGQRAIQGKTLAEIVHHHFSFTPPPPSERLGKPLPAELDALIMSMMAKDPADRPASAREVVDRLTAIARDLPWDRTAALAWWQARATRPRQPSSPAIPFNVSLEGRGNPG